MNLNSIYIKWVAALCPAITVVHMLDARKWKIVDIVGELAIIIQQYIIDQNANRALANHAITVIKLAKFNVKPTFVSIVGHDSRHMLDPS